MTISSSATKSASLTLANAEFASGLNIHSKWFCRANQTQTNTIKRGGIKNALPHQRLEFRHSPNTMPPAKPAATRVKIGDQLFNSKESETSRAVCGAKGCISQTGVATIAIDANTMTKSTSHAKKLLFVFIFNSFVSITEYLQEKNS